MLTLTPNYKHITKDNIDIYIHQDNMFMNESLQNYWLDEMVEISKELKFENILFSGEGEEHTLKNTLILSANIMDPIQIISDITLNHRLTGTQNTTINYYTSTTTDYPSFKIKINDCVPGVYCINENCLFLYALHFDTQNRGLFRKIKEAIQKYGIQYGKRVIGINFVQATPEDLEQSNTKQEEQLVELYKTKMHELDIFYKQKIDEIKAQQLILPKFINQNDILRIYKTNMAILIPMQFQTTRMLYNSTEYDVSSLTKKHRIQAGIIFDSHSVIKGIKIYNSTGRNEFKVPHSVGDSYMGGQYKMCLGSFSTRILKKIETRDDFNEIVKILPDLLSVVDSEDCSTANLSTTVEEQLINDLNDGIKISANEAKGWATTLLHPPRDDEDEEDDENEGDENDW